MRSTTPRRNSSSGERLRRKRKPPGLDPRDIEDFIDQRKQVIPAPRDVRDALRLALASGRRVPGAA